MAKVTFDGASKLIIADAGITSLDARVDLYSDWKEWSLASDNIKYLEAFRTLGGDPLGGGISAGAYYFLRNDLGWRIRPHEADHELTIFGNFFPEDPDQALVVPTLGGYTVAVRLQTSSLTQAIGSGLDTEQDVRLTLIEKILRNKMVTDKSDGKLKVYDDNGSTILISGNLFEDKAGAVPYRGRGAERRERLE